MKSTLDVTVGILWGADMPHFEKLCTYEIPDDVWLAVLKFAIDSDDKQDIEAIGCVIKAQAEKFGRLKDIKNYISHLDEEVKDSADKKIQEMLIKRCNYTFY